MFAAFAACGFICILARPPPQSNVHLKGEGAERHGEAPFPFFLPQRASAALRAISFFRSGLRLAARARPPFLAPRRPKATA